jgi:hypothetical protein
MPDAPKLAKIEFQPGLRKDDSDLASEGGWIDGQWTRFRRGKWEVRGGYELTESTSFTGIARAGHAWVNLAGARCYAWGTHSPKLYATINGTRTDITPYHSEGVVNNPFTTTNGVATVTCTLTDHRLAVGQTITFSNVHSTIGGIVAANLNGARTVVAITDADNFTFTAGAAASSSAGPGGGMVDYTTTLPAGSADATFAYGYSSGTYSSGTYGNSSATVTGLTRWSLDNFGENLVAVLAGHGLYEFQPETAYSELMTNGNMGASTGWATGTGWSIAAGVATAVAGSGSNLSQDISAWAEGGRTYILTFDLTRTAGSLTVNINAGDPAASTTVGDASSAISLSGSYSRIFRMPATPSDILFTKDAAFAGTIDNVSVKIVNRAYRIDEAPFTNDSMFVDPNGIIVLLGTENEVGIYDSLLIRTSDIEDNRTWVADTDNIAASIKLWSGGELVCGVAGVRQNFIGTDTSIYSMSYTGSSAEPFAYRLLGSGCGVIGPQAMEEVTGAAVWWSNNGNFYRSDGGAPQVIPCTLNRDAFDNLVQLQAGKVHCYYNAKFGEVEWLYPDGRDSSGTNKECSRYVTLTMQDGAPIWTAGTLARTVGIPSGIYENPIMFGSDGYVYTHESGYDANGDALTWYIESAPFDIEDGDRVMHVIGWQPDFEEQQGSVSLTLYRLFSANGSEYTFGPYVAQTSTEWKRFRATGRKFRMKFSGSSSPAWARCGAVKLYAAKSGARR